MIERTAAELHRSYAEKVEAAVSAHVGLVLRGTVRVRIAKPRWMPARLYLALMRTIVVEECVR